MIVPSALLVDTNVWLDYFLRRPRFEEASAFIGCALKNHADLFVTVGAMADIAYLLEAGYKADVRRRGGQIDDATAACARQFAQSGVQNLQKLATPLGMDTSDAWVANSLLSIHPDYEDDLMLAAAERSDMDLLVTNDKKLLERANIGALTPQGATALIEAFVKENDLD